MKKVEIGQRFGRLSVIREAERNGRTKRYWICRCDCGKEIEAEDYHLKSGHTKSCGCLRKEQLKARSMDLTGHRYGRLTVLRPVSGKDGIHIGWECRCDCGGTCICQTGNLRSGVTRSCGCLQKEQRKENMKKAIHFVEGTCVERIASRGLFSSNSTGHRGVYRRNGNRWRASIGFQGKVYNLGSFENFDDAVKARLEAEERLYDPFLKKYGAEKETDERA